MSDDVVLFLSLATLFFVTGALVGLLLPIIVPHLKAVLPPTVPLWHYEKTTEVREPAAEPARSVLTDEDRERLVEEIGAIVESSLSAQIKRVFEAQQAEPKGVGSLDEWYGSRSTIPPARVMGQRKPEQPKGGAHGGNG